MPGEELVDLVDDADTVTGTATVRDCLEKSLLHRAVAVLVIRSSGEFLLQRRSKRDLWHPGLWTLSSTGHVKAGESYDQAARRELKEELGITAVPERLKKRVLPPIESRGLTEREWVTVYVARTDRHCKIDRTEVEGVKEVDERLLRRMLRGRSMTPDAVILLTDFLRERGSTPRGSLGSL